MTRKEFLKAKGWDIETYKTHIKGFWNEEWVVNNLDREISIYELWCDKPFYLLNQEYSRLYKEDDDIGSTYDWLEMTASDEDVQKYLK